MTRLWRNNPETRRGEYLVKRRDGSKRAVAVKLHARAPGVPVEEAWEDVRDVHEINPVCDIAGAGRRS